MTNPSNRKRVVTDDDLQVLDAHIAYSKAQADRAGAEADKIGQFVGDAQVVLGELADLQTDIAQSQANAQAALASIAISTALGKTVANAAAVGTEWAATPVGNNLTDAETGDVYLKMMAGSTPSLPIFNLRDNSVGTIAALRTNPIRRANATIRVRGYYAPGDGGGGVYIWQEGSYPADDGGMYIRHATATNGYFLYQAASPGVISVGVYGALPVNDATKGGVRINMAAQGVKNRWERGTLLFTSALNAYYTDTAIIWIPGFTLRGSSCDATAGAQIKLAPGAPAGTNTIQSSSWANKLGGDWLHYARLENLVIDGNKSQNSSGGHPLAVWQLGETCVIQNLLVKNGRKSNIRTEGVHAPHRIDNVTSNGSDEYGFDLAGGGACVGSVYGPSGDNNQLGLMRFSGTMTFSVYDAKSEANLGALYQLEYTGLCTLNIFGGYTNSNGSDAVFRIGAGSICPIINVFGARQNGAAYWFRNLPEPSKDVLGPGRTHYTGSYNSDAFHVGNVHFSGVMTQGGSPDAPAISRTVGTGSPEGVITANPGSEYTRTDGALGTLKYLKATGVGKSGWVLLGDEAVAGQPNPVYTSVTAKPVAAVNDMPYSDDFVAQWTVDGGQTVTANSTDRKGPSGAYDTTKFVITSDAGSTTGAGRNVVINATQAVVWALVSVGTQIGTTPFRLRLSDVTASNVQRGAVGWTYPSDETPTLKPLDGNVNYGNAAQGSIKLGTIDGHDWHILWMLVTGLTSGNTHNPKINVRYTGPTSIGQTLFVARIGIQAGASALSMPGVFVKTGAAGVATTSSPFSTLDGSLYPKPLKALALTSTVPPNTAIVAAAAYDQAVLTSLIARVEALRVREAELETRLRDGGLLA
ncbi:hypothetical protein [Deinococcus marmoris]|uniref:Uncharacterized protein n=1 Tax=Deinococcus marmoris TaxID=249408 RepID=A0A1U7P4L9_9DEIO|nr:hypothetical protein [Deinococcus marmoris]OLV20112.1 hypothetical protein BOO71_0000364 [Deinococcus marmoris]